jgi:hypothetical protein
MSIQRTRRISARTAEDLLNGAGADAQHPLLAATLRAAAGPAQPGEIAGRHQAVAAFQRALRQPAPFPRRPSMIKSALLKLLTVKAAAVAAVVAGTGGVALAASTGVIPNPLNNHPVPAASASRAHPGDRPNASERPGGPASPSPSLVGLCHAYTAGAGSDHGKALDSPAFQALLTAAGGKANVDAFCTSLLATARPSENPSARPGATEHPTGRPTEHPTGRPTEHATGQPSTHPSR